MNKIFAKNLERLFLDHFLDFLRPSSQAYLNFFIRNWDPSLLLLSDVKLYGKKIEKADDRKILHCRQMEKTNKTNFIGHSCYGGCPTRFINIYTLSGFELVKQNRFTKFYWHSVEKGFAEAKIFWGGLQIIL